MVHLYILLPAILLLGCGFERSSEEDFNPSIPTTTISDFSSLRSQSSELFSAELQDKIDKVHIFQIENSFFTPDLTALMTMTESPNCNDSYLIANTKLTAKGHHLILEAKGVSTPAECKKSIREAEIAKTPNGVLSFATVKRIDFKMVITCQFKLDRISPDYLSNGRLGYACGEVLGKAYTFHQVKEVHTLWTAEGKAYQKQQFIDEIRQFQMNDFGEPCDYLHEGDSRTSLYSCSFGVYHKSEHPDFPKNDYFFAVSENLRSSSSHHHWYDQGIYHVSINNWDGDITYTKKGEDPKLTLYQGGKTLESRVKSRPNLFTEVPRAMGIHGLLKLFSL